MAKIFDCFTFFNELDLLELRLKELENHVDHFVLVEATKTFQKKPKPLYYSENKARFSPYHDKIIHVVVDTYPTFFTRFRIPRTWHFENSQREHIMVGLKSAHDDDIVIISDIDEIPDISKFHLMDHDKVNVFEQYLFYFYLNYFATSPDPTLSEAPFQMWNGPVALKKKNIKTIKKSRELRGQLSDNTKLLTKAGWHFSYIGGIDSVIQKLQSFSHKEYNTPYYLDKTNIQKSIDEGTFYLNPTTKLKKVDIATHPELFPKALLANLNSYAHLIKN